MLNLFNSRVSASWLLLAMVSMLVASAFLPSEMTRSPEQWELMARQHPFFFRLASNFSTPYLVRQWWFLVIAFFLFLSTLTCTITRLRGWWQGTQSDFPKEKAFTFSMEGDCAGAVETICEKVALLLKKGGWDFSPANERGHVLIVAQKGIACGFWGSVVFHGGLLLCFLAIPLSAFFSFSGNLLLTEGAKVSLREGVLPDRGSDSRTAPAGTASVEELRGVYHKGKFKLDFGGTLVLNRERRVERLTFSVNQPVTSDGFQYSLQEYGFSPRIVVEGEGLSSFDYYLNLRNPETGDYFPLAGGTKKLFILLFPDFFRVGNRIGSRSKELNNPYLLVRILQGEQSVFERLVKVGDSVESNGIRVSSLQLGKWVNLAVSRERGLVFIILGSLIITLGLLIRFLSNERRLEIELMDSTDACTCRMRGYSRYYPAFLEREVTGFFNKLDGM